MSEPLQKEKFSLEALRAGDRSEFARLMDAYYTLIYRLAFKMLGDAQDAEDILQETFLKAYNHIAGFDGRSSLSTWLYRIATNEALMFLRRRRPDLVSIDEPLDGEDTLQEPVQITDWCCMPEEEMMNTEGRATLDKAVATLSPALRIVFVLRDLQELSTQETAQVLNLSEEAVKTRLSRARLQLREALSGYYGGRMAEGKRS